MFTFQLENDRRTVETSFFFNVNFFSEIRFQKLVDSKVKVSFEKELLIFISKYQLKIRRNLACKMAV